MAPHALTDLNDVSGYYPSTANKASFKTETDHKNSKTPLPKPALSTKIPFANPGFGNELPKNVWRLSADEIDEIEKNVRYFISMRNTSSWHTRSNFLIRLGVAAQRNQRNDLSPDKRIKIKAARDTGVRLWRRAILHSLRTGPLSVFGLPECYYPRRSLESRRQQARHGRSNRGKQRGHPSVQLCHWSLPVPLLTPLIPLEHITAMPVDDHAPADRYHGPPSGNQDIVSPVDRWCLPK